MPKHWPMLLVTGVAALVSVTAMLSLGLPPSMSVYEAVSCDDFDQVKRCAKWGVDCDIPTVYGMGVLHWAAAKGDEQLVELLCRRADVNGVIGGYSPLIIAVGLEKTAIADLLVRHGARVNMYVDGRTPLHWAASDGQIAMVQWLVEHGADPTAVDFNGQTPATVARRKGHDEVSRYLEAQSQGSL